MNSPKKFVHQDIGDAQLVAEEFCKNFEKNPLSVIVTGSYAEGLFTQKSDLDLVLIAKHATDFGCRSGEYLVRLIGSRKVQALVLDSEEFRKTLSTFMSRQKDQTAWPWLDYVNRLTHGVVLSGHESFEKLTEGFDRSRLLRMQYLHSLSRALEKYDDLLGQQDIKNARQAIFFADDLLTNCMNCLLSSKGDSYLRPKWLATRVERTLGDSPLVNYFFSSKLGSRNVSDPWPLVEKQLLLCRTLMGDAAGVALPLPKQEASGLSRIVSPNPWLFVFSKEQRYFVKNASRTFELNLASARIIFSLSHPLPESIFNEWITSCIGEQGLDVAFKLEQQNLIFISN